MVGARARGLYDKQAKERQEEAAARGNKTRHGKESPVQVNLPEPGDARDHVGQVVGVSGKGIDYATKGSTPAWPAARRVLPPWR
jgi:hypothetical protein